MNWIRRNEQSMLAARARASSVLPTPGHVLDQDVPLGQQRDHGQLDDLGLAQDDRADVLQQPVQQRHQFVSRPGATSRSSGVNSCDVLRNAEPFTPAAARASF